MRARPRSSRPIQDLASARNAIYLRGRVREVRAALRNRSLLRDSGVALVGFLSGFTAGVLLWSRQQHTFKRGLFSASPLRRLAALGYLSGRPSMETVGLLRDYVRWEPRAALRRRGERLLRRVELDLK